MERKEGNEMLGNNANTRGASEGLLELNLPESRNEPPHAPAGHLPISDPWNATPPTPPTTKSSKREEQEEEATTKLDTTTITVDESSLAQQDNDDEQPKSPPPSRVPIVHKGYLWKTSYIKKWSRIFVIYDASDLEYFEGAKRYLVLYADGSIDILHKKQTKSYKQLMGIQQHAKKGHTATFVLTGEKATEFRAENKKEMKQWIEAFETLSQE